MGHSKRPVSRFGLQAALTEHPEQCANMATAWPWHCTASRGAYLKDSNIGMAQWPNMHALLDTDSRQLQVPDQLGATSQWVSAIHLRSLPQSLTTT